VTLKKHRQFECFNVAQRNWNVSSTSKEPFSIQFFSISFQKTTRSDVKKTSSVRVFQCSSAELKCIENLYGKLLDTIFFHFISKNHSKWRKKKHRQFECFNVARRNWNVSSTSTECFSILIYYVSLRKFTWSDGLTKRQFECRSATEVYREPVRRSASRYNFSPFHFKKPLEVTLKKHRQFECFNVARRNWNVSSTSTECFSILIYYVSLGKFTWSDVKKTSSVRVFQCS
jgi:hypothetical protein